MAQDGYTCHTHRNHILPYYPKEPFIFPYLRQYHSIRSLLSNPDTDCNQDISSNSPQYEFDTPFESFNPHTSIKTIAQPKSNLNPPAIYQNLPSYIPVNDSLGDILTLQNLILKRSKTLFTILTIFLFFIHVLLTLQISLLSPQQTLKPFQLTFELLILHISYLIFQRKITITQNPLLTSPHIFKFSH